MNRTLASICVALVFGAMLTLPAGCSSCRLPAGPPITVPPVNATPEAVVKAYLAAVIARDTKAARTLTTPKYWEVTASSPDGGLNNWITIQDVDTGAPIPDTYEAESYRQVNRVYVDFTLRQCEEMTWQNGRIVWSYLLVRNADAERWRIASGGLG
ncbi:hypothetical protein [Sphaerisporangium dianthi]|uniref:DUF4829 domain-containing protein n=1 Tax=Sphaerisporangium dianthi TaxID=1436120 RepID=A0ABV9CS65_9ACTN